MAEPPLRVMLVDDHEVVRGGIRAMLQATDDIVVTDDGRLGVAGVPASALTWAELARAAGDDDTALATELDIHQDGATFPFQAGGYHQFRYTFCAPPLSYRQHTQACE